MAKLVYDKEGRLLFTKEMAAEYTVLVPQMLPIHFEFITKALSLGGLNVEVLNTTHRGIIDAGLKHVHNDICFPALLVIGQMIDALKSGKYDVHKVALMITQTGGGCRASNYIHLLRKGLIKAGYDFVPVISLNLSGLESNPGFHMSLPMISRLICGVVYGDALMWLSNRSRAYEVNVGETDALVKKWTTKISDEMKHTRLPNRRKVRENLLGIARDFGNIKLSGERKPRVGVVGEIYVKFAPLGNNNLERFLRSEGAEVVVPGLMDFIIFKVDNRVEDSIIYGGKAAKKAVAKILRDYIIGYQNLLRECLSAADGYPIPARYEDIKEMVRGFLGYGNKMGEGWLLTAEMLELIHSGVNNIVCTQPFGCLPNHIVGKGMMRPVREANPTANIVAIDYDPGTTSVNQENRLKLMLANARKALEREQAGEHPSTEQTERETVAK